MKVAIPVNDDKKTVCPSFGRTGLFALIDTQSGGQDYLDNSAAASQSGAGIKAAQMLLDHGAQAVLTPHCGENAAKVFSAAGVPVYRTAGADVAENVAAFQAGTLNILTEIHPGYHGQGAAGGV